MQPPVLLLCRHSEDMVCSCTPQTRGTNLCSEAVGTYGQQPCPDPVRRAQKEGLESGQQSSSGTSGNFKTQIFIMSTTFSKYLAPDKKDWKLHIPSLLESSCFVPKWTSFWKKIAFILEWNVYTGMYSCHGSCVNKL